MGRLASEIATCRCCQTELPVRKAHPGPQQGSLRKENELALQAEVEPRQAPEGTNREGGPASGINPPVSKNCSERRPQTHQTTADDSVPSERGPAIARAHRARTRSCSALPGHRTALRSCSNESLTRSRFSSRGRNPCGAFLASTRSLKGGKTCHRDPTGCGRRDGSCATSASPPSSSRSARRCSSH